MNKPLLIVFVLIAATSLACTPKGQGDGEEPNTALGPADTIYRTIQGRIEQLPDTTGRLYIALESIPGFRDPNGNPARLDSTIMPFLLGAGVSSAGLREQDAVTFDLLVNWDTIPLPGIIIRLEKNNG